MVGEMVQIQKKYLTNLLKLVKREKEKHKIFGYDTDELNSKELRHQYETEQSLIKEKIYQEQENFNIYRVKTMGKRINTLHPGNSFDSLILFSDEFKSTSSVITECECEFLYLTAKDLKKVLKLHNRHRLRTKVLSLEAIPIFQKLDYSSRLRLSNISKIRTYLDGDMVPIYDEEAADGSHRGKKRALCYWILTGKCEIVTSRRTKSTSKKILVRRDWGSMLHEYGLLQCSNSYYENVIQNENMHGFDDLSKKVKVQCVGKCEFIRFYWDEFLQTLNHRRRHQILKLAKNHMIQLLHYIECMNNDAFRGGFGLNPRLKSVSGPVRVLRKSNQLRIYQVVLM